MLPRFCSEDSLLCVGEDYVLEKAKRDLAFMDASVASYPSFPNDSLDPLPPFVEYHVDVLDLMEITTPRGYGYILRPWTRASTSHVARGGRGIHLS